MHYLSTKKGTRYQSLTTENWPFQCSQLTVGRIVIVFLFSGTEAKYSNNNHLLATVNIHPKSQFPANFRQSLAHFSSSLLTGGLGFNSCGPNCEIHVRMSFLLPFPLFPLTQDLFLQEFVAESLTWRLFAATIGYWAHYDIPATRLLLKPLTYQTKFQWKKNYAYFKRLLERETPPKQRWTFSLSPCIFPWLK